MATTFGDFGEALRGVLWRGLSVVALFGLLVSVVVVTTPMTRAEAQPEPDCVGVFDASFQATVSTEVELDTAIECYNIADTAAGYTISLQANLDYGVDRGVAVIDQSGAGFSLTLEGNGHTITGSGFDGVGSYGVVLVAGSASPVNILGVVLTATSDVNGTGLETGGVDTQLERSTIDNEGAETYGIWAFQGALTVTNSTITDATSGVYVGSGATAAIEKSTIANVSSGVDLGGGGSVSVVNSTISYSRDWGVGSGGNAAVTSSTIAGVGAGTGVVVFGGAASVVSSIVTPGCDAGVVGSDNFVDYGSCGASASLLEGSLGALADNGCDVATPTGCVETFALDSGSNAVDAGPACANGAPHDQRGLGFDRLVGAACDAGSFEAPPAPVVFCDGLVVTINMNTNGGVGFGTIGDDVILGTSGADLIVGSAGDDTVCAGGGDDTVFAGAGADRVFGEGGADTIYGSTGDDYVSAGYGNDEVFGQGGFDVLLGNGGNDLIKGLGANDFIYGGRDDDRLVGNGGVDRIWGGPGRDLIWGNNNGDFLYGEGLGDIIRGGGGADVIEGGDGFDVMFGDAGADTLTGGRGTDTFDGGLGPDTCTDVAGGETATSC